MFAEFEIVSGDFIPTIESKVLHGMTFKSLFKKNQFFLSEEMNGEQTKVLIPFTEAISFEEIDIERINSGDAALLGVLSAVALGPLGLLAGGVLGGLNKKKLFVIEFKDGRKLVGKASKLPFKNLKEAFKMRELMSL